MPTSAGAAELSAQQVALEGTEAVAQIRQLPDPDLKGLYLRCNRAAVRGSLGSGEAALCSVSYETLLKRTFAGDFMALLAWSRSQRRTRVEPIEDPEPAK
jgi:hypothetical protein